MPVFILDSEYAFPNPELSEKSGLLAIGGDLTTERLLLAYSSGIFPWYAEADPILWWSPDPRLVLFPDNLLISKSLHRTIKNRGFKVKFDDRFEDVINECGQVRRKDGLGTWIMDDMKVAYTKLHHMGYAHSVEVYLGTDLVGGLYGVSLGKAFFGESMFFKVSDASKVALVYLVERLLDWGFHFIDAQLETNHLKSMGGVLVSRKEFLEKLKNALVFPDVKGKW